MTSRGMPAAALPLMLTWLAGSLRGLVLTARGSLKLFDAVSLKKILSIVKQQVQSPDFQLVVYMACASQRPAAHSNA